MIIKIKKTVIPILLCILALTAAGCAENTSRTVRIELEALDGKDEASSDALFPRFVSDNESLQKDLDKLDAARKKGAAPNRTSGTRSSAKSSSEAEKIRATHAELLTDLAVIESFDYSKHKLVMEIVRGRQPKSLLWDESSNDRQKENRSQKAASINGHSAASKLRNAKIISREASR